MRPLGDHHITTHLTQEQLNYLRQLRPDATKIVGSGFPGVQEIANTTDAGPDGMLQDWRDVGISEQHADLWSDPEATGIRHADEMVQHAEEARAEAARRGISFPPASQVFLEGINEPVIELFAREEDGSNYDEWLAMYRERSALLDTYMVAFGQRVLETSDYRAMLGNFSDGQPANIKPGGYATFGFWFPKTKALLEANPDRAALSVHEYWRAENGPEAYRDWHTCRWTHLDVACPVYITECLVEQKITSEPYEFRSGWIDYLTPDEVADQLLRYLRMCLADKSTYIVKGVRKRRFRAAFPFTNFGADDWRSYYIESAYPQFVVVADLVEVAEPEQPESPVQGYVPGLTVGEPQAPDGEEEEDELLAPEDVSHYTFEVVMEFIYRWEGGFQADPDDPGNWYEGKLVGTKKGISAKSWAHLYDIPNLTDEQIDGIYFEHYWKASGADKLPWPLNLAHMNAAVNAGVAQANQFMVVARNSFGRYVETQMDWYKTLPLYEKYGDAWRNRMIDLVDYAVEA